METVKFANNHLFGYNFFTNKFDKITLLPYQEKLLNDLDTYRFISINQPRQMGVSTMLKIYIANKLTIDSNEPINIGLMGHNNSSSSSMVNDINLILESFNRDLIYKKIINSIKMKNGNTLNVITPSSFKAKTLDIIVVDNVNYLRQYDTFLSYLVPMFSTSCQIILAANGYLPFSKNSNFKHINLNWFDNPINTKEKYEELSKSIPKDILDVELCFIERKFKEKKSKTISLRLPRDLYKSLKNKTDDISSYIRKLIENDIKQV